MLNLMYITNSPDIAQIAEAAGVDRIFVDLEHIGKAERQKNMDTVQSRHTVQDVKTIASVLSTAELLVRVNPIHEATVEYCSSEKEIEAVIECGADIIMLPFFKSVAEVQRFISCVNGRAKTMLLIETVEAVEQIDDILTIEGIDYLHIGLNDLSIAYGLKFMFELMTNGIVEKLCEKFVAKGIPYGIGGIASIGKGMIPAELIIKEHYRLGSTAAILSRSFCNTNKVKCMNVIREHFFKGIAEIRKLEEECESISCSAYYSENRMQLEEAVIKVKKGIEI